MMTMTAPVFWLLDTVVQARLALDVLVADNLEEYLNQPHHHLSRSELITTLGMLLDQQWIAVWVFRNGCAERLYPHTTDAIAQYLMQDSQSPESFYRPLVYYGLTPEGGRQWEQLTHPNWMRFVETLYGVNPDEGSIASATRQVVQQWFDSQVLDGYEVLPDSVQWEQVQPWQATYWKRLPEGYRVTFLYRSHDPSPEQDRQGDAWIQEHTPWYTHPFLHNEA